MPSIIDYKKEKDLEDLIINKRAKYLMAIREEMIDNLKDFNKKLDDITKELLEVGIDINPDNGS